MKKIIALTLIALLLVSGVAFAATPGRDKGHGRGDVMGNKGRYDFDPHKTFRLVRYVPTAANVTAGLIMETVTANAIVVWDVTSDDGVTITTTSTSYVSTVAGIIVQDALTPKVLGNTAKLDYAQRNWTWLQTYGKSLARCAVGATATAGDALGTANAAGDSGRFVQTQVASSAEVTTTTVQGNAGFWYDSATSGQDAVEVFLRCE